MTKQWFIKLVFGAFLLVGCMPPTTFVGAPVVSPTRPRATSLGRSLPGRHPSRGGPSPGYLPTAEGDSPG